MYDNRDIDRNLLTSKAPLELPDGLPRPKIDTFLNITIDIYKN